MKNKENKLSESNKLRVAAYCRVSTKQEEQDNSLDNQKEYYYNLITSNENWEYIEFIQILQVEQIKEKENSLTL